MKNVRELKEITLEEVYQEIRIDIQYLKSIEEDKFDFLHTPYVIAFVKSYAKYLGMDAAEVVNRLNEQFRTELQSSIEFEDEEIREAAPPQYPSPAGTFRQQVPITGNERKNIKLKVGSGIIALLAVVIILKAWVFNQSDTEPNRQEEAARSISDDLRPISPEAPDSIRLRIVANDTVWLRLKIDENEFHVNILAPGVSMSRAALDSFVLRTGRSTGLEIYLDGKKLNDYLGGENNMIGRLVLTKDGVKSIKILNRD